jgi:hypothetical protein
MKKDHGQRTEIEHGLYRIIAGQRGKSFKAIAYVDMRKVAETSGENAEEAINSLKAFLDAKTAKRKEGRKEEVPSAAEFKDALEVLRVNMPDRLMDILFTHRRLPDDTATMLQLARISSGWTSTVMEVEYARLGRKISRLLGFSPVCKGLEPHLMPVVVFATPKGSMHKGIWKLRPQFAAALDDLKGHVPAKRPNGAATSVRASPA